MRTPETQSVAERAAALNLGEKVKKEDMKNAARDALTAFKAQNATANLDPLAEVDGAIAHLSIHDIVPYRHNPRHKSNPRYHEIKESIRADGITNMISVTRPPGADKYTPYGGGNTRLQIAKELYEEGDTRFAHLTVITKAWPGEAIVISAHLAENENRGDITFWEKALGVAAFKREFESESAKPLTASELNKELKTRGLNYGVRMIQNFMFAVEHLKPVGPWLKSESLNEILRPVMGSYLDLSTKLDQHDATARAISEVLAMHGEDLAALELSNENEDEADRKPVMLDVESLLVDLRARTAQALGIDQDKLDGVASALAQNPRMGQAEIQQLMRAPVAAQPHTTASGSAAPAPASESGQVLPPQTGIPTANQRPLAPMLAVVTNRQNPASTPATAANGDAANASAAQKAIKRMDAAFNQLNDLVPIADYLMFDEAMPVGFWVDVPPSFRLLDGQELPKTVADLRQRIWVFLAQESGQFNRLISDAHLLDESTQWRQLLNAGMETFQMECANRVQAQTCEYGMLHVTTLEFQDVRSHPNVGPVIWELTAAIYAYRLAAPERFVGTYRPLFEPQNNQN